MNSVFLFHNSLSFNFLSKHEFYSLTSDFWKHFNFQVFGIYDWIQTLIKLNKVENIWAQIIKIFIYLFISVLMKTNLRLKLFRDYRVSPHWCIKMWKQFFFCYKMMPKTETNVEHYAWICFSIMDLLFLTDWVKQNFILEAKKT